ncbi:MAG: hypothetical protein ACREHD_25755 [Pirellulales bacterium]
MLLLAAFLAIFTFAGEAQAGLLVTTEQSDSLPAAGEALTSAPTNDVPPATPYGEHVGDSSHDALPSGTGAGSGGVSSGAGVTAVLDSPSALLSPSALSSSLEERHLSLPASPVFDRLRPPRG